MAWQILSIQVDTTKQVTSGAGRDIALSVLLGIGSLATTPFSLIGAALGMASLGVSGKGGWSLLRSRAKTRKIVRHVREIEAAEQQVRAEIQRIARHKARMGW